MIFIHNYSLFITDLSYLELLVTEWVVSCNPKKTYNGNLRPCHLESPITSDFTILALLSYNINIHWCHHDVEITSKLYIILDEQYFLIVYMCLRNVYYAYQSRIRVMRIIDVNQGFVRMFYI